jgi:hypothetical protein
MEKNIPFGKAVKNGEIIDALPRVMPAEMYEHKFDPVTLRMVRGKKITTKEDRNA